MVDSDLIHANGVWPNLHVSEPRLDEGEGFGPRWPSLWWAGCGMVDHDSDAWRKPPGAAASAD